MANSYEKCPLCHESSLQTYGEENEKFCCNPECIEDLANE